MRGASMVGMYWEGCLLRTKSPLIIIIIIREWPVMIMIIKQTCHQRERGALMTVMRREGYGRLLTFPHPISITIPYLQIGRLATGRIYLVAARHGKGRGEGREGGREGGSRKGGEESGSGLCSLSLSLFFLEGGFLAFTVFCFLFFFLVSWHFLGSWYVSSTSPFSSFSRVIVMRRASPHHNPHLEVK